MNRRAGRKCSLMEKYRLKWNIQRFLSFDGLYKKIMILRTDIVAFEIWILKNEYELNVVAIPCSETACP